MTDEDIETNASERAEETLRVYLEALNRKTDTQTAELRTQTSRMEEIRDAQNPTSPWGQLVAMGMALAASLGALAMGNETIATGLAVGAIGILAQVSGRRRK